MVATTAIAVPVFAEFVRDYNYSIGASFLINDTPTMI